MVAEDVPKCVWLLVMMVSVWMLLLPSSPQFPETLKEEVEFASSGHHSLWSSTTEANSSGRNMFCPIVLRSVVFSVIRVLTLASGTIWKPYFC